MVRVEGSNKTKVVMTSMAMITGILTIVTLLGGAIGFLMEINYTTKSTNEMLKYRVELLEVKVKNLDGLIFQHNDRINNIETNFNNHKEMDNPIRDGFFTKKK